MCTIKGIGFIRGKEFRVYIVVDGMTGEVYEMWEETFPESLKQRLR
jgi:hypothetical protein